MTAEKKVVAIRLSFVNPHKIVPNFVEWLSQAGQVEFGDGVPIRDGQYRFGRATRERSGLIIPVKLDGKQIGELECCINPPIVAYKGERPPNIPLKLRRGMDSGSVILGYGWDHPLAIRAGRLDLWQMIPFP